MFLRHPRLVFYSGIYVCLLLATFCLASISDLHDITHTVLRVLTPLMEISLASLLCAWLMRRQRNSGNCWWLAPCVLLAFVYCAVYMVQSYSLYLSNNFISTLALQNPDSKSVTESSIFLICMGIVFIWTGLFARALMYGARRAEADSATGAERWSGRWFAVALMISVVLNAMLYVIPERSAKLEPSYLRPPMASLIINSIAAFHSSYSGYGGVGDAASANGITKGGLRCFHYPSSGNDPGYPFEKDVVYRQPLPYPSAAGHPATPPNVIIFFTEGTSARLIGAYGGRYPGLTPNIDGLSSRSMKVVNYFNHTAATYRGIIGQISSGYSFTGGGAEGGKAVSGQAAASEIERHTLASILGKRGYQTYFFSPEHESSPFTAMLRSLDFHRVYTAESIGDGLLDGRFNKNVGADDLDDQSLLKGLTTFLERRSHSSDAKPFFVSIYNMGTHAFLDVSKYGKGYGDSGSEALNTLHNYDAAVGTFLDYFYTSPYAKNTILVFTSDHAKYPDKPYIKVAGPDLQHYFVDRIPLLILDPYHVLPHTFDADGRNSLDLTPTVLQLLGFDTVKNSFLGNSLFEPANFKIALSSLGDEYYMTTGKGVFGSSSIPKGLEDTFECERGVVRRYYGLEAANHIAHP